MGPIYPLFDDICCLDRLQRKKEEEDDVKVNSLRVKTAYTFIKDKKLKNLPRPSPFSGLETPRASLASSSRPCLKAGEGVAPTHWPRSPLSPFGNL